MAELMAAEIVRKVSYQAFDPDTTTTNNNHNNNNDSNSNNSNSNDKHIMGPASRGSELFEGHAWVTRWAPGIAVRLSWWPWIVPMQNATPQAKFDKIIILGLEPTEVKMRHDSGTRAYIYIYIYIYMCICVCV